MADSEYQPRPAELIMSAFCQGKGDVESLDIGLKAVVESSGFERGELYLISKRALIELCHRYDKVAQTSTFEPKESSLQGGMAIILSCPGPGRIETMQKNAETMDQWQDYFDLCEGDYACHAIIFLIAPMGYNFGFLSLQRNLSTDITEDEGQMIAHTARAMTMVIDYRMLTDHYKNKIDECAATANELVALKDKLANPEADGT